MTKRLATALQAAGILAVAVGVGLVSIAAGVAVFGALVLAVGIALERGSS